jgi:protein-L-isoaspartate O-methyltransferase
MSKLDDRVRKVIATTPRARYLGPPPWTIFPSEGGAPTETSNPNDLADGTTVSIGSAGRVNTGNPLFWAPLLARLDIREGMRIAQMGTGLGYYTAVLSTLVGSTGKVTGYEIDAELAAGSIRNLADRPNVEILAGDGNLNEIAAFDRLICFYGLSDLPPNWLQGPHDAGRLLIPLTMQVPKQDSMGVGFMLDIGAGPSRSVTFVDRTYIHMSTSAKSASAERDVYALYQQPTLPPICRLVDASASTGIVTGSWWTLSPVEASAALLPDSAVAHV